MVHELVDDRGGQRVALAVQAEYVFGADTVPGTGPSGSVSGFSVRNALGRESR